MSTVTDRGEIEGFRVPKGYARELFSLDERVAVVTGGASGLGAAIAVGLAQCGATVVVADIDNDAAKQVCSHIKSQGGHSASSHADVTDADSVAELADSTSEQYGRIDVLVNSAGWAFRAPAETYPEDVFDRVLAINLKGTFLTCQHIGRRMLEAGKGSVINLASIGAFVAYPGSSAYLASKGAVVQLTRSLSLEWSPRGVRVNAIGPTLIDTPLTRSAREAASETAEFIEARMPRRRLGSPSQIIGAAVFLASDASELVTGHTLMCDDGYLTA